MPDDTRLILLSADECSMIRDALTEYHDLHGYVPDEPIMESLMRRIPEPKETSR
jgi:hypothetical protein